MTTTYQRSPAILFGDIGDDVVALSVARGLCYGMENVSAVVWNLLGQPRAIDDICERLLELYEVDAARCRGEVAALLEEMRSEGLIEAGPVS